MDINAASAARHLLERLGGLDEKAKERDRDLEPNIQIASVEIASAALLEFQQAIPDLAKQLAKRSVQLIEDAKPSDPKLHASAGDTLARLGDTRFDVDHWHLPKDLYTVSSTSPLVNF